MYVGAGAVVVGGAGGGFGADVMALGGVDGMPRVVAGGASGVVPAGLPDGVVALGLGLLGAGFAGGRAAREAGRDVRVAGTLFAAGFCCTPEVGFCAGVVPAIAAVIPPVAITAPAATPFVTSESRRRARSRS